MVTFYDDGHGVWMIPYPMKTWCQQHPNDIKPEFRYAWNRVNHIPECVKLRAGEFTMVEMTVDEFNDWYQNMESVRLSEDLSRRIRDTKRGELWLSEQLESIQSGILRRLENV